LGIPAQIIFRSFKYKKLYLEAGAVEVWIYWKNDTVEFYNATGQLTESGYSITVKLPTQPFDFK
jgi:hypothetical protein